MQLPDRMRTHLMSLVLVAAAVSTAAASPANKHPARHAKAARRALVVTSSAFRNTEAIPHDYTCEGVKRPPPLAWSKVPDGTKSFAILVEDPDAPKRTFTHWLVTGIPAGTTAIEPGSPLPAEAQVAANDSGEAGYTPPCPPSGRHRYIFHVYALDTEIAKPLKRTAFLAAIRGHILAQGQVIGTYQKTK